MCSRRSSSLNAHAATRSSPGIAGGAWCEVAVDSAGTGARMARTLHLAANFRSVSVTQTEAQSSSQPGLAMRVDHSYERLVRLRDVFEHGRRAQHASRAERAPRELVVLHERVEAGKVLVEPEHVRDGVGKLRFETARGRLDPQLLAGRRDTVRAPRGTGRVVSSARPARSTRFGGSSATPCETIVRAKSTRSPLECPDLTHDGYGRVF
jgi:hypothetical protein